MTRCVDEVKLQSYFDGELPLEQLESVTLHLASCATCAAMARELEEGKEPWAASHPEVSTVRSAGFLAETGTSFVDASEPLVRVGR